MSELILEILSEEIPARFQGNARHFLLTAFAKELQKNKIEADNISCDVSPCRLILHCDNLRITQDSEKRGPKVDADHKAIEGFARALAIETSQLIIKAIQGQEYYFATSSANTNLNDVLTHILGRILQQISWPKSMRWTEHSTRWARPIRNILCLFSGQVLPLKFGHLIANDLSYGHQMIDGKSFKVTSYKQYLEVLHRRSVILSAEERKEIISAKVKQIIKELGTTLVENDGLLQEIVGLVEFPSVHYGKIKEQFLSLPQEVIIRIMATHQKYLAMRYPDESLAPYFIVVLNGHFLDTVSDIIAGNEKVLSARLYDGKFFFEEDLKIPLTARIDDLKKIIFHEKLGTIYDKTKRLVKLSEILAKDLALDQAKLKEAALLAKADLTTYMVNEFPELQGTIGKYYAEHLDTAKEVSQAIYEHYLPNSKESPCPSSLLGAVIAIADKLDSTVGLFLASEIPTASKDPFALRRNALGIIRIICEFKLKIDLNIIIAEAASLYQQSNPTIQNQIVEFIYERFKFFLKDHYRDDVVAASLSNASGNLAEDLAVAMFLQKIIAIPENNKIIFALKRSHNIVQEHYTSECHVDSKLLLDIEHQILGSIVMLDRAISSFKDHSADSQTIMYILDNLAQIIERFFANTMIIDQDIRVRKHRVAVLNTILVTTAKLADFSLIDL